MKKIFILIGLVSLTLGLVGCNGSTGDTSKTPPKFSEIIVENEEPFDGTSYTTYYMEKEDEVLVEVHLLNPYQYTITSVVINEYNYRFSKFETGSDFEKIIIKVPVGSSLGNVDYTVEEIVYQDGDVSKFIDVTEDNIFEVYVYKENPKVSLEAYNLDKGSLSLQLLVTDTDSVIASNSLYAEIFTNNESVEVIPLSVGTQQITFEELDANNIYEVKVFATYNLLDGNGDIEDILYSGLYSTLANLAPTADISNVVVTANSVSFDVVYNDIDNVTSSVFVNVYSDEDDTIVPIEITESTSLSFSSLINDADYLIKVVSTYDLEDTEGEVEDELIIVDFSTLPRVIPVPAISELIITEDEVSFKMFIDDPNGVIYADSIIANIIVGGEVVQSATINDFEVFFEVFGLLSDFNFDIEIRASFDLNDGLGDQNNQVIYYQEYSTSTTLLPQITINNVNVTQGYITVAFDVLDIDSVIVDNQLVAKLFEDGIHVDTITFNSLDSEIVFEYLAYFDYSYEIVVYTDYDLRDYVGVVADYVLVNRVLTSLTVKAPDAEIQDVVVSQEDITFDVTVNDSDSTLIELSAFANLYLGDELKDTLQLSPGLNPGLVFDTEILSDTVYTIVVVGDYLLVDGGVVTTASELDVQQVTTINKTVPTASISNDVSISSTTLEYDFTILDADGAIVPGTLYAILTNGVGDDTQAILITAASTSVLFTGLLSEVEYILNITGEYNLNTVADENITISMDDINKTTLDKKLPSGFIISESVTQDTYVADITVIDDYSVIVPGTLKAVVYLDGVPTIHVKDDIIVGFNDNVTFTGLDSNNDYELRLVSEIDYNLNTGTPDIRAYLFDDKLFSTIEKVAPSVNLEAPTTGFSTITFDVVLNDPDLVIDGSAIAYLYLESELINSVAVLTENLIVGGNTVLFTGLYSNTTYEIIIKTDYNALDGLGLIEDYVLASFISDTDEKFVPAITIDEIVLTTNSITFDVSGYDTFTVIDGDITAYLYKDGEGLPVDSVVVGLSRATYTFDTDILANQEYEIVVKASYDLDDDINSEVDATLDSETVTTVELLLPFISITNETVNQDQVTLDFDYLDNDLVMTDSNLTANLYVGVTLVASSPVLNKTIAFDISDMLSGFIFTIEVAGNYNLEDEAGPQTNEAIWTKEYQTTLNLAPNVSEFSFNSDGFISADILISDSDNTYVSGLVAELYENSILLQTLNLDLGANSIVFNHMATKLDVYEIRVIESYDLRDGQGVLNESVFEQVFIKFNNQIPLAVVDNLVITQDSVTFDVEAWDPDGVLEALSLKAILYQEGSLTGTPVVLSIGDNPGETFAFTLDSNTSFEIHIIAEYDLDNGSGVLGSVLDTEAFNTTQKAIPSAIITNIDANFHNVSFDVDLTDVDSVIVGNAVAKIYEGTTWMETINLDPGVNNVDFDTPDTIDANTVYSVELTTSYNLLDGEGQQDLHPLGSFNIATDEKLVPTVAISDIVVDHDSITFDTNLIDTHTVLDGTVTATLWIDGVEYTAADPVVGRRPITIALGENTYLFEGLYSGQEYEIIITGSYDLDDGETVVVDGELNSFNPVTDAYTLPFIASLNRIVTENTITFDIDYENVDSVIDVSSMIAELWHDGVELSSAPVYNNTVSFHLYDLLANNDYTVIITADYDLNEESGAKTAEPIFNEVITTNENFLPAFELIDLTVDQTTITIDYDLLDSSSVLINLDEVAPAVIEFVLYDEDGVTELDRQTATLGTDQQIIFSESIRYDKMYEVRIETDYNLRDGTGNFVDTSIYEMLIAAHYKKQPEATATISSGVIGTTDYTFDVTTTMLDVDVALVTDSLVAILYDSLGVQVGLAEVLIVGSNVGVQFTGLTASTDYTIEIVYSYNLDNGDGDIVVVPILDSVAFTTNP